MDKTDFHVSALRNRLPVNVHVLINPSQYVFQTFSKSPFLSAVTAPVSSSMENIGTEHTFFAESPNFGMFGYKVRNSKMWLSKIWWSSGGRKPRSQILMKVFYQLIHELWASTLFVDPMITADCGEAVDTLL